jgi:iterative type I PKS product template protein
MLQGGNACLLLEDYVRPVEKGADSRSAYTIVTSARTPSSHLNKRRLLEWIRANPKVRIEDLAYTTTARRMHHPIRFALTASTQEEVIAKLENEIERSGSSSSSGSRAAAVDVVFVFTGQGSHYAGMGAELYRTSPVFREKVNLCVSICEGNNLPSFLDIITDDKVDMSTRDAAQVQLAVITLEIALAAFWRSTGIEPKMVMGHSLGEYAALHVAGVLSLADTLYLIGHRALMLLERCEAESCAMLAVSTSVTTVRDYLTRFQTSSCSVACINSPNATIISGTADDLAQFQADISAQDSKIRMKTLPVPFAFHSFQMDPILPDYNALAGGVTYLPPKIPVASTLLASVIDEPGVFNQDYLVQQTRQPVDFVGGLKAVKSKLNDPVWLEIGPAPVCTSFVRATLSPPPAKIMHTIDANTSDWMSISKSLSDVYMNGLDIDWLALHIPYESSLELLNLPTYAWDLKDYWITHTDRGSEVVAEKSQATSSEPLIGTCAQYIVQKSSSPKIQVTFRASISDPGFLALIDGHKMQQIGLASGSVFCDAALTAAKYTLEYSGRKGITAASLTLHDPDLLAPLTKTLVGIDGEFITTAVMDSASTDTVLISFKATSARGESHDLGSMRVETRDPEKTQTDWNRISYFIKAKMEERIINSKEGSGHRMQPEIIYALFANAVEFDPAFKGIQEAYIANDFQEAAASVVLQNDPPGTQFTASPYWGEALLHLAGFMVNGNPNKSPRTTFIVMGFESVEQTATLEPGKQYLTYTRISRWENDTAYCDAFVFDPESSKLIMQCVDLRYQELPRATWRHILDGPHAASKDKAPKSRIHKAAVKEIKYHETEETERIALQVTPMEKQTSMVQEAPTAGVFDVIIDSISKATGSEPSEFAAHTTVAELGVDSIMAIEIVTTVKNKSGVDLPAAFVFEYPTIGDLRLAFGGVSTGPEAETSTIPSNTKASIPEIPPSYPVSTPESVSSLGSSVVRVENGIATPEEDEFDIDTSPAPTVRITLLQGRPRLGQTPFYLMADGTGTIATYIHLPGFKSKMPVYGIDSPFLRCPGRLTSKVGIEGIARLIVDALLKAQPEGPLSIGGFSAGSLVAYEVCRLLAAAGRKVDGLLLIDMCCPRTRVVKESELKAEDDFSFSVFEAAVNKDGLWSSTDTTRQHFSAYFTAMHLYHPPSMTPKEQPTRTAVIWAEKGLVNRVADDPKLMQKLAEQDIPTQPYPGFMEDPKLGTFACLIPNKTKADLGPNGWDKYAGEVLALSVDGDHLDLPMPGHAHLLHAQMEKAFAYFNSSN